MHQSCTWAAVAILSYMVLVLVGSLTCRWLVKTTYRHYRLLAKPDTIAVYMSYLCGSTMVETFRDLVVVEGKKRNRVIKNMGRRYVLRYRAAPEAASEEEVGVGRLCVDFEETTGYEQAEKGG